MNIKEVEERTGMKRANIRFYENEGLLTPQRRDNGYRDYSEEDVQELEKLRLLRALELPLESIREARQGQRALDDLLAEHLPLLEEKSRRLDRAQEVCHQLCREHTSYQELDAAPYLSALDGAPLPAEDQLPRVKEPWRRFFARGLDLYLYQILLNILRTNVLGIHTGTAWGPTQIILQTILSCGLVLALEPVQLHLWGTTPGKWLLGLSVASENGGRLSMTEAFGRTWEMLQTGQGWCIPVWSQYRNWKCYESCESGEGLPWEAGNTLLLKDRRPWRIAALAGAFVLVFGLGISSGLAELVPPNRGELTVADYAENYNRMATVYEVYQDELGPDGKWITDPDEVVIDLCWHELPELHFTTDGETMTGLSFAVEHQEEMAFSFEEERALAVLAFVRAQNGLISFQDESKELMRKLLDEPLESWEMTANGVTVKNQVEQQGYADVGGMLVHTDEEKPRFRLEFSMELTGNK